MESTSDNNTSELNGKGSASKSCETEMNSKNVVTTILFFLSFVPVLYAIYNGFTGVFFGFGQGAAWFYGLGGFILTLIGEMCFLFLPVWCLVFQIHYAREFFYDHQRIKHASRILIGVIAVSAIASCVFGETTWQKLTDSKIRYYLAEKYSDAAMESMNIRLDEKRGIEGTWIASTPILPSYATFEIHVYNNMEVYDTLLSQFADVNPGFYPALNQYVAARENIPADFEVETEIISVDFQDYHYGDDYTVLFDRIKYAIKGLKVDYEKVTEDVVMNTTDRVWQDIYPSIPKPTQTSFCIMITEHGVDAVSVWFHKIKGKFEASFLALQDWGGLSYLNRTKKELSM